MARTGLRMMPTSPSPPLKFRTVGFPQYGYKASLSDGAFQTNPRVEVDSRQTLVASPVCPCPSRTVRSRHLVSSESHLPGRCARRCARGLCRATPGVLGSGASCAVSRHPLTTTPSVSLAGTRRFRGTAVYTSRLRCAGAPRRPARPSLLSLPCCPHVPSTIRQWVRDAVPLLVRAAIPGFLGCKTSRHPRPPSLPAILDGKSISALHRSR